MYGQEFVLKAPLIDVECWNFSDGKTGRFDAGETIRVLSVYDSTHTTISATNEPGRGIGRTGERPVWNRDGTPYKSPGYRFIVPNALLATAIDADVPATTPDLIGDLIAYESGEATDDQEDRLFRTLRETGIGKHLQGHYSSRM